MPNRFEIRLRDHLNGHEDAVYKRIALGEDLSKQYPMETQTYNEYIAKGESLSESTGISQKRMDE